jgi:aspartate kinase
MLEMASQGAKVLQARSVEMAMKHRVRLQVLSSFEHKPGTLVTDEDEILEKEMVSGIAYSRDEAKITLFVFRIARRGRRHFRPARASCRECRHDCAERGRRCGTDHRPDLYGRSRGPYRAVKLLEDQRQQLGYADLTFDATVVKVSVIGVGCAATPG